MQAAAVMDATQIRVITRAKQYDACMHAGLNKSELERAQVAYSVDVTRGLCQDHTA